MIRATDTGIGLQVSFSNGREYGLCDVSGDKGGGPGGFEPFELLEASLATCIGMTVRFYANRHDIPLERVTVQVSADRSQPDQMVLHCTMNLAGPLTDDHRKRLLRAAEACPVRKALQKRITITEAVVAGSQ